MVTFYSIAMFIGYEIYEEAEHGFVEYLLSLPLSRRELAIGRSLGGGLTSILYMAPLLGFILELSGTFHPLNLLIALSSVFLFTFGVSGLSITLAVTLKSSDKFDVLVGFADAFIIRLSTALYPRAFMPIPYAALANFNPITYASDILRWALGFDTIVMSPLIAVTAIVAFTVSFVSVAVFIYEMRLEGGSWR